MVTVKVRLERQEKKKIPSFFILKVFLRLFLYLKPLSMFSLRIRQPLCSQHILKKALSRLNSTSVEPAKKPTQEYYEKELKEFETLTNIQKKIRPKKPQREPFVKNLLLGKFDTEMLVYPQLDLDEVKVIEAETQNLEKLLKQRHMVDVDTLSNKNFRQNLSDHRAIGLQASQFLDGRESTPMEVMKYLETLAEHKLRDSLIHHEMLGVQTLVRYGDEKLQKKYLYPIMKGEKVIAFCMSEENLVNESTLQTTADLSNDKKHWNLNGTKSFVVNGITADYLIVFATSMVIKRDTLKETKISAFLVEKDSPGVSWKKIEPANVEIAEISFDNVRIPAENVIGEVHEGEKILNSIISDFRMTSGAGCITMIKNMLNQLHQDIVNASTEEVQLHETEAVRSKLGEIAMNLYVAESVAYFTAGLQDWYENQDVTIESAIVKVLSSEAVYNASTICLEMLGQTLTLKDHWARRAHDEALNYMTLYETNDSMRMFIALMGLKHAGVMLQEEIKKLRNPLFHGTYILSRIFTQRRNSEDDPKLNLDLNLYLHPSLHASSKELEYCVKRLQYAAERILTKHGLECVNKHVDLRRIADVMIDCYAMTAVLSRASRAYCIGLQFADYDMVMATAFCTMAKERVQKNVLSLYIMNYRQNDQYQIDFAKQITRSKKYFIESPIRRFF